MIQILQPHSKESVSVVMTKEQMKFSIFSSSGTGRMSAIHDLTRLFYGARCVFAHGDHTKTFSQGGALYEFEKIKDKLLNSCTRGAHVYELYEKIRDGRRRAQITEDHLELLEKTIMELSLHFYKAIQEIVREEYGLQIWSKTEE